jgi:hypothetical protein
MLLPQPLGLNIYILLLKKGIGKPEKRGAHTLKGVHATKKYLYAPSTVYEVCEIFYMIFDY